MLRATIQSILGLLALCSTTSAQGSTASIPGSGLVSQLSWQAESQTKITLPSPQETLLRKCQTWRCQSTALHDTLTAHAMCMVCYEKQGILPGSNLFQPHCSPIRSSNKTTAQEECLCMRAGIHTERSIMTVTCTLDLTWHLQHQRMALLHLMLYRGSNPVLSVFGDP